VIGLRPHTISGPWNSCMLRQGCVCDSSYWLDHDGIRANSLASCCAVLLIIFTAGSLVFLRRTTRSQFQRPSAFFKVAGNAFDACFVPVHDKKMHLAPFAKVGLRGKTDAGVAGLARMIVHPVDVRCRGPRFKSVGTPDAISLTIGPPGIT